MKKMDPSEMSKCFHAARLVIDGSFRTQGAARKAMNLPVELAGRVSDAHTLLMHGAPEMIAAVESGQIPFHTGWEAARILDRNKQLEILHRITNGTARHKPRMGTGGREVHGLYTGRKDSPAEMSRSAIKQHGRVCDAVDKLFDAIVERVDALGVCTSEVQPVPEADQARKWRRALNRCRRAFTALEKRIDWIKIETENSTIEPKQEGDRLNDASTTDNSDNGPLD